MFISRFNKRKIIYNLVLSNPYTSTYGLGRSLIALGTLIVFVFNDFSLLFNGNSLDILKHSEYFFNQYNFFVLFGSDFLWLSKLISIAILIFVISGFLPILSGVLHFWISYSFYHSAIILDGGDQIAVIFTFLLLPLTLLDNRINHWYREKKQYRLSKLIGNLSFFTISIQVSYIYLNTVVVKLTTIDEWKEGTATYYFLKSNYFGVNSFFSNIIFPFIDSQFVFFITWFIIISHLTIAFVLFLNRKIKKHFIFVGLLLHLLIAILMGLYSFSIVMFGVLVLYMLPYNFKIKKIIS